MTKKKVVLAVVEKEPQPVTSSEPPVAPATPEDTVVTPDGEIAIQAPPTEPVPAAPPAPDPLARLANLESAVAQIITFLNKQTAPQTIQPGQGEGTGLDLMQIVDKALSSGGGADEEMIQIQKAYMKNMLDAGIRSSTLTQRIGESVLEQTVKNIASKVVQETSSEVVGKA